MYQPFFRLVVHVPDQFLTALVDYGYSDRVWVALTLMPHPLRSWLPLKKNLYQSHEIYQAIRVCTRYTSAAVPPLGSGKTSASVSTLNAKLQRRRLILGKNLRWKIDFRGVVGVVESPLAGRELYAWVFNKVWWRIGSIRR